VEPRSADPRRAPLQPPLSRPGELIDHLLVSKALVHRVAKADTGPVEPPSVTEDPTERRDEPASDHAPVWARFELG
jgi:exonuclease III